MPADRLLTEFRIETERLVLRPPRDSDIGAIVEGIGDFAVSRMLTRVRHPYGRTDAEDWLFIVAEHFAGGTGLDLAITLDGGLIGVMGIGGLPTSTAFGYWLARPHWGKGFATEAARSFLAHVFANEDVAVIRSGVFADNPLSLRVQEKLGFRRVGISRAFSLARQADVDHIDTLLEKERFLELNR